MASTQVTGELREASRRRLHQTAKSLGIEILDQLRRAESDLTLIGETLIAAQKGTQFDPRVVDAFLEMLKGTAAA